jgi:hypothetical protein
MAAKNTANKPLTHPSPATAAARKADAAKQ